MSDSASTLEEQTTPSPEQTKKSLKILLELFQFIKPYRGKVAIALIALIFTASLTLTVGHGVRILIDQGFTQRSTDELGNAIQFMLVIIGLISSRDLLPFLSGVIGW